MKPDQARQWREARNILDELIDLDDAELTRKIEALDLEPAVRDKLDRLIQADRSPQTSLDPDAGWLLQADEGAPSLEGRQVGAWILERPIGEGGMSTVYRCRRDTDEYQQVGALKLLRIALLTRAGKLRFEQEKRILAGLRHPHIAGLLDAGTAEDGTPFIVLELVDGQPIDRHARQEKLSTRQIVALMLTVCRAVAFAQQSLVVHRDIKPSNILVDAQGEPRLLDFGIARLIEDEEATATTTRAYTPGYAAPEQFSGGAITTATDVFGLGATLYRLLTGRPVYEKPGQKSLPPLQFDTAIDRDLKNVLRKAVDEDPQQRYRDAASLADDLSSWLASRPVQATGRSTRYALAKFAGRHKFGVTATALLLLTAIAGVSATVWQARLAREQAELAQRESQEAQAVRDFLIDLFEATAGGRNQNELPTTAELLERAAQQAKEAYDDRPALKAEMLKVTGTIYGTQGRNTEAQALLSQALEVSRTLPERDWIEEARIQAVLARALANSDRDAEAVAPAREAFQSLDPGVAEELLIWEDAGDVLIGALLDTSQYEEAKTVARAVYEEVRRSRSEDSFLKSRSAHTLATVLSSTGNAESAIELLQEAWRDIRDNEERLEFKGSVANGLAIALERAQRHEEALPMARESVAIARRAYAPGHPRIGRSLNNLSSTLAETGRLEEAAEVSAEALQILAASLGKDHLSVAAGQNNLGSLNADLGRHARALEAYAEASRIVALKMGKNDWRRAVLMVNQADSHIELAQYEAAETLVDAAEAIATATSRDDQLANVASMRAKLRLRAGRPDAASASAARAVELGRELYPGGAGLIAQNLARLFVLADAGSTEASQRLQALQQELDRLGGQFDRAARNAIWLRTHHLRSAGKADEAETLLQADVRTVASKLGAEHPTTQLLRGWLEAGPVSSESG